MTAKTKKNMPKIVQIACGNISDEDHLLYALGDNGKIYVRQVGGGDFRWYLHDEGKLPEEEEDL